jgi:DNA-directed RNA polymerase II subunit RPB1
MDFDTEPPLEVITGVQFSLLSPDQIRQRAQVEVTTHELYSGTEPVRGGVLDMRMGVVDNVRKCPTCGHKNNLCAGHFGFIEMAKPVFFVQFLETCKRLLKCVCFRCSSLVLSGLDLNDLRKLSRAKRFEYVYAQCTRSSKRMCSFCKHRQPSTVSLHTIFKIVLEWRKDARMTEPEEGAGVPAAAPAPPSANGEASAQQIFLYPEDVERIFKRISDADAEILGFDALNRPEWMICTCFPVLPPSARPTVHNEIGQRREDDLTHKISDIVKFNQLLKAKIEAGASAKEIEMNAVMVQYHVATFADNNIPNLGPSTHRNGGRPLRSLIERLKAKEGRIRGNLMGKRVNFSARSVITPDPNISIDELGVPLKIAMNLTFPEVVNDHNIEGLQEKVDNGPDVYPGARYVRRVSTGMTVRLNRDMARGSIVLEHGDVVERHLVDGDYVLFNRQPSLHRMSMMGHRVRVMPNETFRLNVCVTPCYNADYDGDEMNMHVPQSVQTAIELQMLAAVPLHILSPRLSAPIINIVQDIALGVYRLTAPGVKISRKQLFNLLSVVSNFSGGDDLAALPEGGDMDGRSLLSFVVPKGTYVSSGNVRIEDGVILQGQVTKKTYADDKDSNNLLQVVFRDQGSDAARRMLDDTQRLICEWLCVSGFSVGVSDLILGKDTRDEVNEAIQSKKQEITHFITSLHDGTFKNEGIGSPRDYFEERVKAMLEEAKDKVNELIKLDPTDNRLMCMVTSGSKGKPMNVQQMTALLGQQGVEGGKRVPYGFEDRTLPHFTKYDDSPEARGFVENGFLVGLTPAEFYFHAMAGREGLIDTAVKTSDTGYIQRKLVKAMEDAKIAMDMTVRSSSGGVLQFAYGGDCFDSCRLEVQEFPTIKVPLPEVSQRWGLTEQDATLLKVSLTKEAFARLEDEPWVDEMRGYTGMVLDDRKTFAMNVSKGKRIAKVYFPVNMSRIVATAQRLFSPDGPLPSDLTPGDILKAIAKFQDRLRPAPLQPPNVMLGMMLRAHLNPRDFICRLGLGSAALAFVLSRIEVLYMNGLAHPSELVGVIAAQSIGEPATQMTLNTFHSAGNAAAAKAVQGVPRLAELLHASKNIKSPSMTIFLKRPACDTPEGAQAVLNELETTYLKDVVTETSIWYDPADSTTNIEDDVLFVAAWRQFSDFVGYTRDGNHSPWLLRMEVDRDRMLEYGLTMTDLFFSLRNTAGDEVAFTYSDDNFDKMVLRLRIPEAKGRDVLQDLKQMEQSLLDGHIVKGISGIHKVIKTKKNFHETFSLFDNDVYDFRSFEAFVLDTDGSNLREVLGHPQVDSTMTVCNDVQEILTVLGVEAARAAILEEINTTLADLFVQSRHLELLADVMTARGGIMPIDRHGINKNDIGPLAKISFEQTEKGLIQSAVFGELDKVTGVSAAIMLGQIPNCGTGDTKYTVNAKSLTAPYKERTSHGIMEPVACSQGLSMLEVDLSGSGIYIGSEDVPAFKIV